MKKIVESEKGAIAALVVVTVLMFALILMGTYMAITNLRKSQLESDIRIQQLYGGDVDRIEEVYEAIEGKEETPTFTTVANAPDISGFNKSSTYYVSWNLESSPYEINDTITITENPPNNWYDYTEGVNHYANIKTTGGGNDCYWVWIPRYAYCITEGYHSDTASTIDIKFLDGATNIPIDGSNITISNSSGSGKWNVHPAFWFDNNNNGVEDEGEQLTGIWVAKYEASSSAVGNINLENGTLTGDTESLNGTGGGTDTNLKVRVKPNVTSWRGINANNIFTVCQNLIATGNSLENTNNLNSHMMKNIEWGAIAYLSSSKYGKTDSSGNRERVFNNPYYNNVTNYSPITGLAGTTATQVNNATTTNLYVYNTKEGIEASTTGNVYGIYDMAGGAFEYVAGIYIGGASNNNSSKLWDANNLKYVDQYEENVGSYTNYYGNTAKYGDAVYETSGSGGSTADSWEFSNSWFPVPSDPVFIRGRHAYDGSGASIFAFSNYTGETNTNCSFRPVVLSASVAKNTTASLQVGDYIQYNSGTNGIILCRVLYTADSEYGLQIISDKSVTNVALGVENNFTSSKTEYNNAIGKLNEKAEDYINTDYVIDARCVGSVPTLKNGIFVDKNSETLGPVTMQFSYSGSTKIDCKGTDNNYEIDQKQMQSFNLWGIGEEYW